MENISELRELQLNAVFKSPLYKRKLSQLVNIISTECQKAENEASVVSIFELELFQFLKNELGITYYPEKEKKIDTERHISYGRIDSKINALIIEYKHPSKLKNQIQQEKATQQIINYIKGIYKKEGKDLLGIITDGIKMKFIKSENGKINEWHFEFLSFKQLDYIIKNIILLEKTALNSFNLVKDFCKDEKIAFNLVRKLYDSLNNPTKKTSMLKNEWQELFRLAHDDETKQTAIQQRRSSLTEIIGEDIKGNEEEYNALFALQTAYAIIVKIIGYKVISKIRFNKSFIEFNKLADTNSSTLRIQLSSLEEGAIFRNLGIGNLLEGDFFSWYSSEEQWNNDVYRSIKDVFNVLTRYEDKAVFNTGDNVQDLFKDLYIEMIPEKVRHSLGEFYTPAWLANFVLEESLQQINHTNNWKGMDPCAGSGTFVTTMIGKVLEETSHINKTERLYSVLNRVKAIDLNPLAALTTRINYFINIAHLLTDNDEFEIPVYLGDASYVPEKIYLENVLCLKYQIKTIQGPIDVIIPKSAVSNPDLFSKTMMDIEEDIKAQDENKVFLKLFEIVDENDKTQVVSNWLKDLSEKLVELEKKDWNGIWARILTNFLTTANLGYFDVIIGNPPWIDWKNLPEGYREKIKELCLSRDLFSGDARTGGINLDICALIANVSAQNWLEENGVLSFLMPQKILFQQSYEGFRNFKLDSGNRLYFQKFTDWTRAGHPFKPVTEKFLTVFLNKSEVNYKEGIDTDVYIKKRGKDLNKIKHVTDFEKVSDYFDLKKSYLGQTGDDNTRFSYANSIEHLKGYNVIAGKCSYIGREGIEFYPQELLLLKPEYNMPAPNSEKMFFTNYQGKKSKYKIPSETVLLEKKYLHPLIKGVNIGRFNIVTPEYVVPFPYKEEQPKIPMDFKALREDSPLLAKFLYKYKSIITSQTNYSKKIINNEDAPFYALARVGKYSYAKHYVAFRDNTKWQAAVVSEMETEWGENKRPLFQNHAVSICEREDGSFITEEEAHYICAILNAPITKDYVMNSSDSRSFKIRPPVKLPLYEQDNPVHKKLSSLSKKAHKNWNDELMMNEIDKQLDKFYLEALGEDINLL
ncbi:Eco57I restriction-modification methylase domain-containing protein [Lentibacillus salinarum]|uniref:site-specific DNA-methyltransferase (adenine-specific) n=1 Tax=Lentibacillus salinarum TaxID=446820 RepID=A0ABW3ZXJ0_9BACI